MTTRVAHLQSSTATFHPNLTPASIVATPSTMTGTPGGTRTPSGQVLSSGGRPIAGQTLVWEIDDHTNFSINSSTGQVTYPLTDGLATAVRARLGGIVSNDIAVVCSAFSGRSAAATAILESIRVGLSNELVMLNHIVPGTTAFNTDATSSEGILVEQNAHGDLGDSLQAVADSSATYGTAWQESLQPGPNIAGADALLVSSFTRGSPTLVTVSNSLNTYLAPNVWYGTGGSTTVTVAPSPATSGTLLTVADGSQFQSSGLFVAYPPASFPDGGNAEIVRFTRSGNDFTLLRARTASTARAIANGWIIKEGLSAFCVKWYNGDYSSVNTVGIVAEAPGLPMTAQPGVIIDDTHLCMMTDTTAAAPYAPSTPAAVIRRGGGSGGAKFSTKPAIEQATFSPSVLYSYWRMKFKTGFVGNDGAGSQKGLFLAMKLFDFDFNGGYNPGWIWDTIDPVGAALTTIQYTSVDLHNGAVIDPPNNATDFAGDEGRGTYHSLETIARYPTTALDPIEIWFVREGTQVAHATYRVTSEAPPTGDGLHHAWRYSGMDVNIVYGGGGSIPPGFNQQRFTAEIFIAGAYADPNEKPHHFALTCAEGVNPTHGSLIHIHAIQQDANNHAITQTPGWDYIGTYATGYPTPDFTITGTNGAVREGLITRQIIGGLDQSPEFIVPIRLSNTPGPTTITLRLYTRANNFQRTGGFVESSINLTSV